ncbi:hypothetical protein GCM10018965_029100 [Nonomuraea roseola]
MESCPICMVSALPVFVMVPFTGGMEAPIPTLVVGGPDVTTSTADRVRCEARFPMLDIPFVMAMPYFRVGDIRLLERSVTMFSRDVNRHPAKLTDGAALPTRRPIKEYTALPVRHLNA